MKTYVKPELFYERYELSQHIANCDIELQAGDVNICSGIADAGLGLDGWQLFVNKDICTTPFDGYCETNGGDGFYRIFNS